MEFREGINFTPGLEEIEPAIFAEGA